ncbi:hypothetical protein CYLTODRAFT_445775 [Cylindrobasidium torrendii FP15055 ss-10]|uniref:Uncharacterized protein n=1 Tax=Cylindrobasidium torrendii FP15055 ss-10 TaxID=1314674 RepID=A0A0D7B5L5_9AGAR|nr:hypothetical protein CYLTODRAFT_445775 [Cylindrobasidium torrendii FP15055 ss-10]
MATPAALILALYGLAESKPRKAILWLGEDNNVTIPSVTDSLSSQPSERRQDSEHTTSSCATELTDGLTPMTTARIITPRLRSRRFPRRRPTLEHRLEGKIRVLDGRIHKARSTSEHLKDELAFWTARATALQKEA